MLPTLKVYKIDFDFIISNYLDKHLWKKKWNLFVYKDNVFTINLYKIDMEEDCIYFKIRYNKRSFDYEYVTYYNDGRVNMKVFMKEISGAIFRLMCNYEQDLISHTPGYKKIKEIYEAEKDLLREIAERYLDENSVTNSDIREAYIDSYVSNNSNIDNKLSDYKMTYRFNYLTEMMLIYAKSIEDENRITAIRNANSNKIKLGIIESEVDLYLKEMETTEYVTEMEGQLESI